MRFQSHSRTIDYRRERLNVNCIGSAKSGIPRPSPRPSCPVTGKVFESNRPRQRNLRYVAFQVVEVAVSRRLFRGILRHSRRLAPLVSDRHGRNYDLRQEDERRPGGPVCLGSRRQRSHTSRSVLPHSPSPRLPTTTANQALTAPTSAVIIASNGPWRSGVVRWLNGL